MQNTEEEKEEGKEEEQRKNSNGLHFARFGTGRILY